jgi:hypothetical protein
MDKGMKVEACISDWACHKRENLRESENAYISERGKSISGKLLPKR